VKIQSTNLEKFQICLFFFCSSYCLLIGIWHTKLTSNYIRRNVPAFCCCGFTDVWPDLTAGSCRKVWKAWARRYTGLIALLALQQTSPPFSLTNEFRSLTTSRSPLLVGFHIEGALELFRVIAGPSLGQAHPSKQPRGPIHGSWVQISAFFHAGWPEPDVWRVAFSASAGWNASKGGFQIMTELQPLGRLPLLGSSAFMFSSQAVPAFCWCGFTDAPEIIFIPL
jgi:hypothetical protein